VGGDWRSLYPWTTCFLDRDAGRVAYVDEGQGPPILCVHGNPTWGFYWRAVVDAFHAKHRVVVPDHLGCGRSDKPQAWSYRLSDHIANLEALVLDLDLCDITLLVHDWGGAIGMGVAGRHPDRFSRLLVTNTAAFPFDHFPWRIAAAKIPALGELAVRAFNGFAGAATIMATEKGLSPEAKAGLLAPYDSWQNRIATHRFVVDIPRSPEHPSWEALLQVERGLATLAGKPTAIAWGERDWCFTPAFRDEWQRRFPAARVHRFEDAGHYVMEDAREGVLGTLRELLG
jgi:haloalkane dehalogenase